MNKGSEIKGDERSVERVVHEVRRTTLIPSIQKERFVFERHGEDWHVHFAAATNYSLTQIKEVVEIMENLSADGRLIVV